jgi:DNA-binding MarR family transcriptional regulator
MREADVKKMADQVERDCVGLNLRQLNRFITTVFNTEFAPVGITSSQFNVLTAIVKMQPASPAKIARVLHLEKSSLSRNLELMRRNGWLKVGGNRRNIQISLTAKGENVYARTFPRWERAQTVSRKIIGDGVAKNLRSIVRSLGTG